MASEATRSEEVSYSISPCPSMRNARRTYSARLDSLDGVVGGRGEVTNRLEVHVPCTTESDERTENDKHAGVAAADGLGRGRRGRSSRIGERADGDTLGSGDGGDLARGDSRAALRSLARALLLSIPR